MRQKDKLFQELRDFGFDKDFIEDLDTRGVNISTIETLLQAVDYKIEKSELDDLLWKQTLRSIYFGSLSKIILLIKDPKEFLIYYYYSQREHLTNLEDWLDDLNIFLTNLNDNIQNNEFSKVEISEDEIPADAEEYMKKIKEFHAARMVIPVFQPDFIEAREKVFRWSKNCFDEDPDKFLENLNTI
jgi:hypothetical protein